MLSRNRWAMMVSPLLDKLNPSQGISCVFISICFDWIVKLLSNSDDDNDPRKSVQVHLWELQKKTHVSRCRPRDEVNTSPSFSGSVREPQTEADNWAHTLCAGPQLQSCSRTIMHHHNSTNMPKLILQRWMERSQKQPSCEKPPLSSSPDSIQAPTVAIGILINRLISLQLMLSACKQL